MRSIRVAGMVAVLAALGTAAPVEGAVTGYRFEVPVGTRCTNGYVGQGETITVTLRAASGRRLGRATVQADAVNGSFQACFRTRVTAGRRLTLAGPGGTHSLVVPRLDLRVDRVSDSVSGHAPAGLTVMGNAYRCYVSLCAPETPFSAVADGSGRFAADLSPRDLIGGDLVQIYVALPGADVARASTFAPFLWLGAGGPSALRVQPDGVRRVAVNLRRGGTVRASASGRSATGRSFGLVLRRAGAPVRFRAGDRIASDVAPDARLTVPWLGLALDAAGDRIDGHCFPGQYYQVTVFPTAGSPTTSDDVAFPDGSYFFLAVLEPGWRVRVECVDARGDRVRMTGVVP